VCKTQLSQNTDFIESTELMKKDMEVKTTLNDHLREDNFLLLEKLQVNFS
jgi:hypothetical protein